MTNQRGKLVLDLSIFALQKTGGISVVWGEYLRRLKNSIPDSNIIELLIPDSNNMVLKNLDLQYYKRNKIGARGKYTKYLPSMLKGSTKDVLHSSYYMWYPLFKGKKIITVHDFTHEIYARGLQRIMHNIIKRISIESSDIILCISESTRIDLLKFYPGIENKKEVFIIPNAAGEEFYRDPTINNKQQSPFFLWVGGRSGYKNFEGAIQFLLSLRDKGMEFNLVVVGQDFSLEEKKDIEEEGLSSAVILCTNIEDRQLRQLYSNAFAFLYLSHYEGFGLPILEAQKCGCPVICLPTPASIEVGRETVLFHKEDDPASIIKILRSKSEREKIIVDGKKNAERYNWDISVDQLVSVYKRHLA